MDFFKFVHDMKLLAEFIPVMDFPDYQFILPLTIIGDADRTVIFHRFEDGFIQLFELLLIQLFFFFISVFMCPVP